VRFILNTIGVTAYAGLLAIIAYTIAPSESAFADATTTFVVAFIVMYPVSQRILGLMMRRRRLLLPLLSLGCSFTFTLVQLLQTFRSLLFYL
jgi:hypothetical protein